MTKPKKGHFCRPLVFFLSMRIYDLSQTKLKNTEKQKQGIVETEIFLALTTRKLLLIWLSNFFSFEKFKSQKSQVKQNGKNTILKSKKMQQHFTVVHVLIMTSFGQQNVFLFVYRLCFLSLIACNLELIHLAEGT